MKAVLGGVEVDDPMVREYEGKVDAVFGGMMFAVGGQCCSIDVYIY